MTEPTEVTNQTTEQDPETAAPEVVPAGTDPVAAATPEGHDAPVEAIDLELTPGVPAAKADVTHEDIARDPQADVLAWDPKPLAIGDPTVPRADSHDPRPDR